MRRGTQWYRRPGLWSLPLVLAVAGACSQDADEAILVQPDAPQYSHLSGNGVEPIEVQGNVSCMELNDLDLQFPSITSDFGFKIEGNNASDYNGTFTLTDADGILTGGAIDDPTNSVTVSSADGTIFDWTATLGIDAVIVKGGPNSNTYVYVPESTGDTGLHSPVNDQGGIPALSHIEWCYDYELTAEKTAEAEYTRTFTWEIDKSVDPASHSGFLGSEFVSAYDVAVQQTVTDSDHQVVGEITVSNPTPFEVTYGVEDLVAGSPASVNCPSTTLLPGASATCTYEAALGAAEDGTNVATVTSATPGVQGATAEAAYAFGEPTTIVGEPTVNISDTNGQAWTTSSTEAFTYAGDFVCPTDQSLYTDGVYTASFPNTATIVETGQSADASVDITCYALVVSKTAETSWSRTHDWTIGKSVDPDAHSGNPGDAFSSTYTVSVDETITEGDYVVSGAISVHNPSNQSVTVGVSDDVGGTAATLTCGGTLTIAGNSTATCGYSAELQDRIDGTNTATITLDANSFEAAANYAFSAEPTTVVGFPDITVSDTNGQSWITSDDMSWTYQADFTCSSEAADYADGAYTETFPNTASIDETGASADASVNLTCTPFDLAAEKTADAGYDERHTWDVEKSVTPVSQGGYPGDVLAWTWTVDVSESFVEEGFAVSGDITVSNANPFAVDFSAADVLSDGTTAAVSCPSLTVPGNGSVTCTYAAAPDDRTASLNTATITSETPGIGGAEATAPVAFIANVINGTADLTDIQGPLAESLTAGGGPWSFSYGASHTCSSDAADYGADGTYSATLDNTADLVASDGQSDQASASTSYLCEAAFVDVTKTTNGIVNPDKTWTFALYEGPDGFGGVQVGSTSSTAGDADGILDFSPPVPALRLDATYTVCELDVPAGWSTTWEVGANLVVPYNPNADDDPPEDLGNRCLDFGAGTVLTLGTGQTLSFLVDNSFPGGAPRTPGYWKNWNRVTGGNQQFTADANGGSDEGYWLVEDVLNNVIHWGDFAIAEAAVAVDILDKRLVADPLVVGDGRKVANDPLHNLAAHLLAAQLNFGAGACTTQDAQDAAAQAEALLAEYNFDGDSHDQLKKKDPDAELANQLAELLDQYNNGAFCGS